MFKRMWQMVALLSMSALLLSSGCGIFGNGFWAKLFDWQKISQAVLMDSLFD